MRWGVFCIALMIAGASLGAAQPPQGSAQQNQAQPTTQPAPPTPEKPDEYQKPCGEHETNRKSDLCAQWKAAEAADRAAVAAEESTTLNWWQLWIGLAGAVGLVTALGLTIWSNIIARQSAEAQVRAWLTIEFEEVIGFRMVNKQPHFKARLKVENVGKSPALAITYWMGMAFGGEGREHLDNAVGRYLKTNLDWKEGSLFPSDNFVRKTSCEHNGEPPGITKVSVYLIAVYRTALSRKTRITAHLYDVIDTRRTKDWTIDFRDPPSGDRLYMRTNKEFPGYAT
jgi:hypothetical protein